MQSFSSCFFLHALLGLLWPIAVQHMYIWPNIQHIKNIDEDAVNQQTKVIASLFQCDTEKSTWFWPNESLSNCRDGKGKGSYLYLHYLENTQKWTSTTESIYYVGPHIGMWKSALKNLSKQILLLQHMCHVTKSCMLKSSKTEGE